LLKVEFFAIHSTRHPRRGPRYLSLPFTVSPLVDTFFWTAGAFPVPPFSNLRESQVTAFYFPLCSFGGSHSVLFFSNSALPSEFFFSGSLPNQFLPSHPPLHARMAAWSRPKRSWLPGALPQLRFRVGPSPPDVLFHESSLPIRRGRASTFRA